MKTPINLMVSGRVSKFRHLKGTPMHKSTFIENIRNVSRQVSGECDGFHGKGRLQKIYRIAGVFCLLT